MSPPSNTKRDMSAFGQLAEADLHNILGYQLAQATVTTTQVFSRQVGQGFELRPVEFTILALVDENPGVSAKQLALALALAPPNITVWIDRLERRGLVQRERSTTDRRAQHIRTTPRGAALAREAVQRIVAGERAALAGLSAAESAMLVELLHKVARARGKS
jgi:DNA-binding MarR family transcriptional regulator